MRRQGWRLGVGRFVAGETLDDALEALHALEAEHLSVILDLLGEFVESAEGAEAMTHEILRTLDVLASKQVQRYMSVKPTQLGLGLSVETALANATRIAERARDAEAQVCLDMENYPYVEGTLELYHHLHAAGHHHVSTVLQSYLKRSPEDLAALLALEPKPTLRVVKGAYRENADVAYPDKRDVDHRFRELTFQALDAGAMVGIATHDESIIHEAEAYLRGARLPLERYEFQLLYGVKPALQKRLVEAGHTVRIYLPYGQDWYGYFSRRLAERPANLLFVLRGLFG